MKVTQMNHYNEFVGAVLTVSLGILSEIYLSLALVQMSQITGIVSLIVAAYTIFIGYPKFKERVLFIYRRMKGINKAKKK